MKEMVAIISILLIFLTVYTLLYNISMLSETKVEKKSYTEDFQFTEETCPIESDATVIKVPAVDRDGKGVMATLSVSAKPGIGRTLVDINQILFWVDTQDSIRISKTVAANVTGLDISKYDIIYSIQANASVIEGPSAGAALGVATIAELENKTITKDVSITGTLDEDGVIGQVGGIDSKAQAAKNYGMNLFLVPDGQKMYTAYSEDRVCEQYLFTTICRTEIKPTKIDVEKEVKIQVEEVGNIREALKYFFQN